MTVGQPYDYVATIWSFGHSTTINAGQSRYLAAQGGTGSPNELAVVALHAGTLKNLRWSCALSGLLGVGNRITLYVNGTATPLVASWDGAATSGTGAPDLIPVAPGDTFSVRIQLTVGGTTITRPRVSIEFEMPSAIPWLRYGPDMYYDAGGKVGIGIFKPRETLSVNGTVEAMTGGFRFPDGTLQKTAFVVPKPPPPPPPPIPPGSVIAYAGASVPAGWLLCDGSFVLCTDLPDLFAAIGFAHGETADQLNFALPDYRGLFLRGVSGSSDADPDAANRMPMGNAGGNTGNAVGSVQWFETLSHQHSVGEGVGDSTTMVLGGGTTNRLASFATDQWNGPGQLWTGHRGGNETRPKNAYVNFLIKT